MMRGHYATTAWLATSTIALVRLPGREDLAEMAAGGGTTDIVPVEPPHGVLKRHPLPPPGIIHRLHRRERNSLVKNRMRESCSSGSVRGGGGNVPTYSAPVLWRNPRLTVQRCAWPRPCELKRFIPAARIHT